MRDFKSLTGVPLEKWFKEFFTISLKFDHYYQSNEQVRLQDLGLQGEPGGHLEIDGILLVNRTCILLEYTSEGSSFSNKIKKFTRNCNLLLESTITLRNKFELLGVPEDALDDFEDVNNWKFVYFGTNSLFDKRNYKRDNFPDYPNIKESLFIFRPTQLEYLRQLASLINAYAKNELLATLEFLPSDLGDDETMQLDYIKTEGKYITTDRKVKADIYLLKISITRLLKVARVSRYEGIPFILDSVKENPGQYQRLLIDGKLKNISDNFIKDDKKKAFPNTITIVLSKDCVELNNKLSIPKKFSSIDIVDGQHRLFAYTMPNISQDVRDKSEILASAIKFESTDDKLISKNAAKVFCEINSNQAKVKNNLIYLIMYDVLGDRNETAIAGKVLLECDRGQSVLSSMFLVNSLKKKNAIGYPSIPITIIIDNDLAPLIKGQGLNGIEYDQTTYERIFGESKEYFESHPGLHYKRCKAILEEYFNYVEQVFNRDWQTNSNSSLISSKYFSAFIRLLRYYLYNEGKSVSDMRQILLDMKLKIDIVAGPANSISFPKNHTLIPSTRNGIVKIYDFLKAKC